MWSVCGLCVYGVVNYAFCFSGVRCVPVIFEGCGFCACGVFVCVCGL